MQERDYVMKKVFTLSLFFFVLISCFTVAAEPYSIELKGTASINWGADTLSYKSSDSKFYMVIDRDGNPLTPDIYTDLYADSSTGYYKAFVQSDDGVHCRGILNSEGKVLVPPEYMKIEIISPRWQLGVKGVLTNSENGDLSFTNYDTNQKNFYRIDIIDFYFDGNLVGSLTREQYSLDTATAYGSYIRVKDFSGNRVFYNNKMEASPYTPQTTYSEYDEIYNKKTGQYSYIHNGSGQEAFVPDCTLKNDEVENPYLYNRGAMYDLQGNVVFQTEHIYDRVDKFKNGYFDVRIGKLHGMIDETGKEIIPVEYERFSYTDFPFYRGYIGAVKNGKFGFIDKNGAETCEFVYSENIVKDSYTFATVKNLDGRQIVLSAAVGEFPMQYSSIESVKLDDSLAIYVQKADGEESLIDIYGNTVFPWGNYRSIELNHDSTIALVSEDYRSFKIYHLDITAPEQDAEENTETTPVPELVSVSPEQEQNTQSGRGADYWYGLYFEQMEQEAENGSMADQFKLGYAYDKGEGIEQDYEKAAYWYNLAAQQGHNIAMCNLGYLYYYGRGIPQNYEEAANLYCSAAEQGYDIAQLWCGYLYENGKGVSQDYEKASYWYILAAEQGNASAQKNIADLISSGKISD